MSRTTLLVWLAVILVTATIAYISLQEECNDDKVKSISIKDDLCSVNILEKRLHAKQDNDEKIFSPLSFEEEINIYIEEVCKEYGIDSNLVKSVVHKESNYIPDSELGGCVGLMQVSIKWHFARAKKLGVTDLYDPRGNILVGVDYLSQLFSIYHEPELVLMIYNMGTDKALSRYKRGEITDYARDILDYSEKLRGR